MMATVCFLHLLERCRNGGEVELVSSDIYNDIGLSWDDLSTLDQRRVYEPNEGWYWDGSGEVNAVTWGGCLESIDEMLRHDVPLPTLKAFEEIVLFVETSEEMPSADYVFRVYRALGERGILSRLRGVLVGRPKAWEFDHPLTAEQKRGYRAAQRKVTLDAIRRYNSMIPIVQNLDFGHTDPQICLPVGMPVRINTTTRQIVAHF